MNESYLNMEAKWLIIGISGVTCGGKTTLAKECLTILPKTKIISQDDYFFPEDSPNHVYIPELDHFNWELLSSLDMNQMCIDIKSLISNIYINTDSRDILKEFIQVKLNEVTNRTPLSQQDISLIQKKLIESNIHILLIEGFSIFNYSPIEELCHLKFYLTLKHDVCFERRKKRIYDPVDVPGYFEKCVWPEHVRQLEEIRIKCKNIIYLTENDTDKCTIILKYLLDFSKTL